MPALPPHMHIHLHPFPIPFPAIFPNAFRIMVLQDTTPRYLCTNSMPFTIWSQPTSMLPLHSTPSSPTSIILLYPPMLHRTAFYVSTLGPEQSCFWAFAHVGSSPWNSLFFLSPFLSLLILRACRCQFHYAIIFYLLSRC